jgi:hypothetical protein
MIGLKNFTAIFVVAILCIDLSIAHVSLTQPVGGESFRPGTLLTIAWELEEEHDPIDWDLYYSADAGDTWTSIGSLSIDVFEFEWLLPFTETEKAVIRVVQDNDTQSDYEDFSGLFTITRFGVVTAIDDDISYSSDLDFHSYPNPIQSETTIEFSLPHHNSVSLEVFSLQGAKVSTLINRELSEGRHSAIWNANAVKPGLYLYRLQVGVLVETRKLLKIQ